MSVRIESNQQVGYIIQSHVENKILSIAIKNENHEVIPHCTIFITYVLLSRLAIEEVGSLICKEPIESSWLGIIQNGKGNADLRINVTTLDATITKTGNLKLSGSASCASILNTGPGNFEGNDLEISEATITIKDEGNVSVRVEDELKGYIHGRGKLLLKGQPRIKEFVMG